MDLLQEGDFRGYYYTLFRLQYHRMRFFSVSLSKGVLVFSLFLLFCFVEQLEKLVKTKQFEQCLISSYSFVLLNIKCMLFLLRSRLQVIVFSYPSLR